MDQDITWHGGGPWSTPHCARWGSWSLSKKGAEPPPIFSLLYCGQTAGCIKMPLGMEISLSPGYCVRWGPSPLPKKGRSPPIFDPRLLWPNGCIDQDAAWYGGRRRPTRHCFRWGPSSPSLKGHSPPIFGHCPLWLNGVDGLRCHMVWRQASAQAILCST